MQWLLIRIGLHQNETSHELGYHKEAILVQGLKVMDRARIHLQS